MKKNFRRIASHEIVLENGSRLTQSVLELWQGVAIRCYPLTEELPQTEWVSQSVSLRRDEAGLLRAYVNNKVLN